MNFDLRILEHCTGTVEVWVRVPVQVWIFQVFLAAAQVALKFIHSDLHFKYKNSCIIIIYKYRAT